MRTPLPQHDLLESASSDGSYLLRWAGLALCGFFLATVLADAWPVALLQPTWQLRIARSLLNAAVLPLVGACLIRLAQYINRDSGSLLRLQLRIRQLAVWATLGFVLLIPLQTAASLRQLRGGEAQVRQRLQQVSRATDAIEKATTAEELRAAILQVPGSSAPELPATFRQPIPQVRARLLEALRPRIKAVETRLQNQMRQAWQRWMVTTARDNLKAVFLAIGFAALARPGATQPPLLWSFAQIPDRLRNRRRE